MKDLACPTHWNADRWLAPSIVQQAESICFNEIWNLRAQAGYDPSIIVQYYPRYSEKIFGSLLEIKALTIQHCSVWNAPRFLKE